MESIALRVLEELTKPPVESASVDAFIDFPCLVSQRHHRAAENRYGSWHHREIATAGQRNISGLNG